MGIEIEKSFVVHAPADAVWEFLTDPRRVAGCLPGAAITEDLGDGAYGGTIGVKVGPVSANYRGRLRFERLDREAGEAEIVASGQETRGKGAADLRMRSRVAARGAAETEVQVTSDVNVVGVLAQFGRSMIDDVSDQLFERFTTAMRAELEPAAGGAEKETAATAGAAATAAPVEAKAPVAPEALDLGALGAKAAGRAAGRLVSRPLFWVAAAALALLLLSLLAG